MSSEHNRLAIALASDDDYCRYLAVTMASILKNAAQEDILDFYILDAGISPANKKRLTALQRIKKFSIDFVKVDARPFEGMPILQKASHANVVTYYRFMLAELMPNLERVIYLDCDTIVLKSLQHVGEMPLENKCLAATGDQSTMIAAHKARTGMKPDSLYFNAGFMVCDLAKWRKEKMSEKFFEARKRLDERKVFDFGDQDAMNLALEGKVLELPWVYNANMIFWGDTKTAKKHASELVIAHYISADKPDSPQCKHGYRHLWAKYLYLSGFPGCTWSCLDQWISQHTPTLFIHRKGYHESSLSLWKLNLIRASFKDVFRLRLFGLTVVQAYRKNGKLRARLLGIPII